MDQERQTVRRVGIPILRSTGWTRTHPPPGGPKASPGDGDGHNAFMDSNQTRIIELLREVHLIAFKEIERLNMRIAELENQHRQPNTRANSQRANPDPSNDPSNSKLPNRPEVMNEHQVAELLGMSVTSLRRWRASRMGPKFLKIGKSVRYRRPDVETWLNSCPGLH